MCNDEKPEDRDEPRIARGMHLRGPLHDGGPEYLFTVSRCRQQKRGADVTLTSNSRTGVGGTNLLVEARAFFPDGVVRAPFRVAE